MGDRGAVYRTRLLNFGSFIHKGSSCVGERRTLTPGGIHERGMTFLRRKSSMCKK